ncbi:MAG: hypothetical protein ACT4PW_09530 [Acidimicrobiia bacterium]
MGAMLGLTIGYVMGTKAGPKGFEQLKDAWKTISSSDEVKDILTGAVGMLGGLLQQGRGILAERLAVPEQSSLRAA